MRLEILEMILKSVKWIKLFIYFKKYIVVRLTRIISLEF